MQSNFLQGGNSQMNRNWGAGVGQQRGVRPIYYTNISGHRDVDSAAEFIQGMAAMIGTDSSGKPVVKVHDGSTAAVAGIFVNSKTSAFYLPYRETIAWKAIGGTINLKFGYVKDLKLEKTNGTNLVEATDYTLAATNGVVTVVLATSPAAGEDVIATYNYKDLSTLGYDSTLESGKIALYEGPTEAEFEVFDTAADYTIGATLYVNASGLISGTVNANAPIGICTKVPTAGSLTLGAKLTKI